MNKYVNYAIEGVLLVVIVLLCFRSCSKSEEIKGLRELNESLTRLYTDTINSYKDANGNLVAEKNSLVIMNERLKKELEMKPEEVVKIHTEIEYRDKIVFKELPSGDPSSTVSCDSMVINKRYKTSYIKHTLYGDNVEDVVYAFKTDSKIDLDVSLEESGRLKITTDVNDFNFNVIDSRVYKEKYDDTKMRKRWGVGIGVHTGYAVFPKPSPYIGIGVGLNFTPKKWQW